MEATLVEGILRIVVPKLAALQAQGGSAQVA